MPKYFITQESIDRYNNLIFISGENADHLITTLRSQCGDIVTVCDGLCVDYKCEITEIFHGKNKQCTLKIISSYSVTEPRIKITLFQAPPKSGKMEYIIQKCVEMGIYNIVPVYTDNSSVSMLSAAKLVRYNRISEAAAKQSMRGFIPRVGRPLTIEQAIADSASRVLVLAPYENERQTSLKDILTKYNMTAIDSAAFFIGPEGGFSNKEADLFREANIPCVSLGARILRTETAGFAVLTILMYACNELG